MNGVSLPERDSRFFALQLTDSAGLNDVYHKMSEGNHDLCIGLDRKLFMFCSCVH
jgi:hypothetical protein